MTEYKEKKKPYHHPNVFQLGSVKSLTKGANSGNGDGHSSGKKNGSSLGIDPLDTLGDPGGLFD